MKFSGGVIAGALVCVYVAFITGLAAAAVGESPKCVQTPYDWKLPVSVLLMMLIPAFFSFIAGKEWGSGK